MEKEITEITNTRITVEINQLSEEEVRKIFEGSGAVMSGHFVLKNRGIVDDVGKIPGSGDHSLLYVNKEFLYKPPDVYWWLCGDIAQRFKGTPAIDLVAGLMAGTIAPAWLLKQFLYFLTNIKVESVYAEEDPASGKKVFKRGFDGDIRGKNILFYEDITTTGESLKLAIDTARLLGGNVIGAAVMCNRSGGEVTAESLGIPRLVNQLELSSEELEKYLLENCPLCKNSIDITPTPGHGAEFQENQKEIQKALCV